MRRFKLTLTDASAGALLCLIALSGALNPLGTRLLDWRFEILRRPPSGNLVVVEIDPRSLEEEARWPWSRELYANAVTNLVEAGAATIALDVDFSSRGDEAGDQVFMETLNAYPGQVILPEFSQSRSPLEGSAALKRTAPHAYFLDTAILATANLFAEANGVVRRGWCGAAGEGGFRGSIAGVLANQPPGSCSSFLIDYAIDPSKLTRLSFVDVEKGNFDSSVVAGKQVLIGATAIELGDEFATPVHGLLPGVALHALSYESLIQGRAIKRVSNPAAIILGLIVLVSLLRMGANWSLRTLALHATVAGIAVAAPLVIQKFFPLSLNTAPVIAAQSIAVIWMITAEMKRRAQALLSQRIETLKHQALISLVVRESSDGIIITDKRGRIEVSNEPAGLLLGLSSTALAGRVLLDVAPDFPAMCEEAQPNEEAPAEYVIRDGEERVLEIVRARTTQASSRWLYGSFTPEVYFAYSLRDVTARKALEKAERAAKDAAIAAATFKTQLIANMSHELRTPLNAIVGFADMFLREEFGVFGSPEYMKYAKFIRGSGERLLGLVTDILFVSQVDAGEVTITRDTYSLREILDDCFSTFQETISAGGKAVTIKIAPDFPALNLDFEVISRALRHLISNAVKFTPDAGAITVRADYSQKTGVCIVVEDNGHGVAADHLPLLSSAFFQADASLRRGYEGTGLGLYVAQKCIALHDGALRLESELGKGFKAIIRLPSTTARQWRAAALAS